MLGDLGEGGQEEEDAPRQRLLACRALCHVLGYASDTCWHFFDTHTSQRFESAVQRRCVVHVGTTGLVPNHAARRRGVRDLARLESRHERGGLVLESQLTHKTVNLIS